ncbi:response regulator transcription factor [Siccirubricoccus sp. G192]|uniref:response regulator transcription factor n=1 Tax=Siccirubricoccus sp. G192 TaxID=2849651 RepID=UPI001C2C4E2E|nr:response regulator transcription factor [Siccirubricoccus sp. G192]MBV1796396.1 response regulator transcription factor [Siccirubricoccus sp. G192]
MARILLVEDDPRIADFVQRGLEAEGHLVEVASDVPDGLARALAADHDLLVLDRMLPSGDGLGLCRALRGRGLTTPVLLLTARNALSDKIEGLRGGGADDYLTKPFAFDELVARVEALVRRGRIAAGPGPEPALRVGDLELDPRTRRARRGGREIELTAKEFALLEFLMLSKGQAVSRSRLLANVWGYGFDPGTKVVDVYIRYLRQKLDEGEAMPLIHTMRGFGYRLAAEPAARATAAQPSGSER